MTALDRKNQAGTPETEVKERKARRRHTPRYKLSILEEIDRHPEKKGEILRREGLYAAGVKVWYDARAKNDLSVFEKKRGRKPHTAAEQCANIELETKIAALQAKLDKAELIIELQKKVFEIYGVKSPAEAPNEKPV